MAPALRRSRDHASQVLLGRHAGAGFDGAELGHARAGFLGSRLKGQLRRVLIPLALEVVAHRLVAARELYEVSFGQAPGSELLPLSR
jgi:hypothetical protein